MNTPNAQPEAVDSTALFDNLQPWQAEMAARAMSGEKFNICRRVRRGKTAAEYALEAAKDKVNEIEDKIHNTEVFLGSLAVALKEWTEIRDALSNTTMSGPMPPEEKP